MSIYIKNLNKPVGDEVIVLMPDGAALLKGYPQPLETMEIIEVPEHGDLIDMQAMFNGEHNLYSWFEIEEQPIVIPADKDGET